MLRVLVILLLMANGALWAWRYGLLGDLGDGGLADTTREPQRLHQQVAPHLLRLLNAPGSAPERLEPAPAPPTPEEVPATSAAGDEPTASPPDAPAPSELRRCWQLAALTPAQADAVRSGAQAEAGLRGRSTELVARLPQRWIVYVGPFPNAETLQRRRAELRAAGIEQRTVNAPGLMPGLALGTYSTPDAARQALADLQRQGVRDARVVQERPETQVITLRWPDLTDAEQERLQAALSSSGLGLAPCP